MDGAAPVVTINAPPATVKPDKNAAGRWQVNLTGTANDASGIRPESLLVKLEQQSGVGVAQTAQQATLMYESPTAVVPNEVSFVIQDIPLP